jgi:hypothetical protein
MTTVEDPVRVAVPSTVARWLARLCTLATRAHEWQQADIDSAREVLGDGCGRVVVCALAERLARPATASPGWAVLALPARLADGDLQRAAARLLAAPGRPFDSIPHTAYERGSSRCV